MGREGVPGTCLGREGGRLWLEAQGKEPRHVPRKRREESVAGREGKGAQVRVCEEKGRDCGCWGRSGSTLGACWEDAGTWKGCSV